MFTVGDCFVFTEKKFPKKNLVQFLSDLKISRPSGPAASIFHKSNFKGPL